MCLVSNVVVRKKFYVPKFIKYTRIQFPMTHLKSHCNKMSEVAHNKILLMHFFSRWFKWGSVEFVLEAGQYKNLEMERSTANALKVSYYKHVMGILV
jgi:hypothetical protein